MSNESRKALLKKNEGHRVGQDKTKRSEGVGTSTMGLERRKKVVKPTELRGESFLRILQKLDGLMKGGEKAEGAGLDSRESARNQKERKGKPGQLLSGRGEGRWVGGSGSKGSIGERRAR